MASHLEPLMVPLKDLQLGPRREPLKASPMGRHWEPWMGQYSTQRMKRHLVLQMEPHLEPQMVPSRDLHLALQMEPRFVQLMESHLEPQMVPSRDLY
eukprot:gene47430-biopygen17582